MNDFFYCKYNRPIIIYCNLNPMTKKLTKLKKFSNKKKKLKNDS